MFVGSAAIMIGSLLLFVAIFDGTVLMSDTVLMSLAKWRLLVDAFGKTTARWIIGAIGMAVIAMGVLIASGWRVRW